VTTGEYTLNEGRVLHKHSYLFSNKVTILSGWSYGISLMEISVNCSKWLLQKYFSKPIKYL